MKIQVTKEYLTSLYNDGDMKMPELAAKASTDLEKKITVATLKRMFDAIGLNTKNRPRAKQISFEIIEETELNIVENENFPTDFGIYTEATQESFGI